MKTIYARRIDGDYYDCRYGDEQRSGSWTTVVSLAREHHYDAVKINNWKFRLEDDVAEFTVTAKQLSPRGWTHLLGKGAKLARGRTRRSR